jgi:hypothetical protein
VKALKRAAGPALVGLCLMVVAGCGPSARLAADTPSQAVTTALEQARVSPLVATFTGTLGLDTSSLSNLPASIQPALGALGTGGSASSPRSRVPAAS